MRAAPDPAGSLVELHLPLVRSLARKYAGSGEPFDELVQVGSVGLVAAARRFDPARGVPFAAYAAPTVEGELRRHLRDRVSTIRVPRREKERAAKLRRTAQAVSQKLGHEASLAETAAAAGMTVDDAELALRACAVTVPLAALEGRASDEADEELAACVDRELVRELVASLAPRERQLVGLRFGSDLSQTEIAELLAISQSQASRLLAGALRKLRSSPAANEMRAA